ncbi:phage tail family protein [Enterococcus casseliflavus]|uniref:phage tail domain-containing protein n=1 Tax=Enterococcus casseliflavus TaxID=37734 RepID=UPI002DBCFBB9|nr:phage tail domain-containing protein [Enterococcus casseliflavus]MEB8400919.1 phage tail family protein [Enterococcus casseliflavus]
MINLRDNTKFYVGDVCLNSFLADRCSDYFILKCEPEFPNQEHNFEIFEGSDGQRLVNSRFDSYHFHLEFMTKTNDKYDTQLLVNELKTLLFSRTPFYIRYSLEDGKRFKVLTDEMHEEMQNTRFSIFTVSFNVFEGRSESVGSSLDNFDLDSDWQFSQGVVTEDYEYTHDTSRFIIYNAGDFTIDPREHDLRIRVEGESDGQLAIFNRTTGERFIYYPAFSTRRGDWVELDGVYPRRNGVNCGIDTNHGLITLVPGENDVEIQNISRVKSEWDFRFLYR